MNKVILTFEFLLVHENGNKIFRMTKEVNIPIKPSVGLELLNVIEDYDIIIERLAVCMKTNQAVARSSRRIFYKEHDPYIVNRFFENGWVEESEYFRGKTMKGLNNE